MKLTGGTAFPTNDNSMFAASEGMTLRDYFAAKAMQALIHSFGYREGNNIVIPNNVSDHAYTMADAMLKAREHGNS